MDAEPYTRIGVKKAWMGLFQHVIAVSPGFCPLPKLGESRKKMNGDTDSMRARSFLGGKTIDQSAQDQVRHDRQNERDDDCLSRVYEAQHYDLVHNIENQR
jgi:hypothetical protein